jgi:hypothetical protein
MPKMVEKLAKKMKAKGMPEGASYAIATKVAQKAGKMKPAAKKKVKK